MKMWVKLLALTFLAVLLLAHLAGAPDQLLGQPLSMFRDGPLPQLGYLLFALLILLGAMQVVDLPPSPFGVPPAD